MAVAATRRKKRRTRSQGSGVLPRVTIGLLVMGAIGAMAIEPTRQLIEQRNRISAMSSDVRTIESQNRELKERIERLKDPDFIEQRAREQGGLILPGETPFVVMPPTRKEQKKEAARAAAAAAEAERESVVAPEVGPIEGFLNFLGF